MAAIHLYVPDKEHKEVRDALKSVPRDWSVSKVVKWIVLVIVLSERDLKAYIKLHPDELDIVRDQLSRIVKRLKEVMNG